MADAHDEPDEAIEPVRGRSAVELEAVPAPMAAQESEGVRVGEAHPVVEKIADPERVAMAAIVAEVAAVERFAAEETAAVEAQEKTEEMPAIGLPPPPPPRAAEAPIIVEPASIALFRKQEAADAAAAAALSAEDAARLRDEKRGFIKLGDAEFRLPGTDLLEYIPPTNQDTDKQPLYDMAERVEQAMSNYGVRGKVKEIHMGPVVTMYEFAPAPGTRTGKIANLEKDLAMALEAQAVRIVAPIPGKAVVGVEVPNKSREMVYLKEILQDTSFATATSKLQVALGKDIKGAPVSVNLSKMPHLLVAGTTGSGKSVAVNGMITSLLYNASPEEVRFIMVDPKMLELSIYEGIPHLLLPVVTDPKKANLALRWAVDEMERRYELLAKTGVRDIASYNARIEGNDKKKEEAAAAEAARKSDKKIRVVIAGPDGTEQEVDLDADAEITLAQGEGDGEATARHRQLRGAERRGSVRRGGEGAIRQGEGGAGKKKPTKLPYIVIVIDEFADLMMVAPKDVETSVARLAQKARAAGMHLILATQRPSVDVITGLIKANFPSRIALQVASQHRLAHHPRSARAPRRCSATATCCSRTAAPSCGAFTAPSCRTRRFTAWSSSSSSRPSRSTTWTSSSRATKTRRRAARRRATSTTSSTTRRSRSSATRARRRSRTSSGGCRSATTAPRAWSSRWSARGSSVRRTAPSPARCWPRPANTCRPACDRPVG